MSNYPDPDRYPVGSPEREAEQQRKNELYSRLLEQVPSGWGPLRPFAWYRPRYGEDAGEEPEFRTTIPPPGHGWIPVPGLIRDEPEDWAELCKNS